MVKMFMKLIEGTFVLLRNQESDNGCCSTYTSWEKFSEYSNCAPLTSTYHNLMLF